jgi:hypothetical protein
VAVWGYFDERAERKGEVSMTEAQWVSSTSPRAMVEFLERVSKLSERKARLFAVACCRRAWHLFTGEHSRRAVTVAEWDIDGLTSKEAFAVAARGVAGVEQVGRLPPALIATDRAAWAALTGGRNVTTAGRTPLTAVSAVVDLLAFVSDKPEEEHRHQAALLRDIVANPFGPPPHLDPAWLRWQDATVLRMATAIYEESAFGRMPLLGDALMDAGCDDEAVLAHCRQQGAVHARGCWVIDLLTGRE